MELKNLEGKIFSITETAKLIGNCRQLVDRSVRNKLIPSIIIGGRHYIPGEWIMFKTAPPDQEKFWDAKIERAVKAQHKAKIDAKQTKRVEPETPRNLSPKHAISQEIKAVVLQRRGFL